MTVSPFNMKLPLDSAGRPIPLVHPNSSTIMTRVNSWTGIYPLRCDWADQASGSPSGADFNHPVFFAKSTDPLFAVIRGTTGGAFESGGPFNIRIPQSARPARGGDGHMCVIQPDGVTEYDLWDVTTDAASATRLVTLPTGGGTIYARGLGLSRLDGSGLNTGNGDATAAKFGLLAGPIRGEEMVAEKINHALFFTIKGHNNTYVYPALASGGAGGYDGSANAPPMGARFFLDYSYAEIEALSIPRYRKTILHALREYGAFAGDAGGSPIDMQPLSGTTYTALGKADPFRTYMNAQGVTGQVDWRTGVDWTKLKVADPSSAQAWPFPVTAPAVPTGLTAGGSSFQVGVSNREYDGLTNLDVATSDYSDLTKNASNLIFRNCTFGYLGITNPSANVTFINCTIGLGSQATPFNIHNKAGVGVAGVPSNVILDGCLIKDAVRPAGREDIHIEGLHVTNVNTLWIKNCTFRNNSLYNISLQNWTTAPSVRYVLIENNTFEPCHEGFDVDHDQHSLAIWDNPSLGSPRDVIIRNNVVKTHDIYIDTIARTQNCVAYNNRNQSGVPLPNIGV